MNYNQFDIIVVGAGALGTFHAYQALKMGKKVLLLEKDKRAQEATVRNFGQVVPSGLPPEGEWHAYGRIATAIYREIQQEYNIGIRNNGSCYIASTDSEVAVLEEIHARFSHSGYDSNLWTKEQVIEKYAVLQTGYAKGALFFPQEISAEPELMIHKVQEYLSLKFKEAFSYRTHCAVIDVTTNAGKCTVTTADKMTYTSEHCFVCSGRDFKILFPELFMESGLVVSKLNMMSTKPLPHVHLPGNILTGLTIRRYESFTTTAAYKKLDSADVPQDCRDFGIHILFKQREDGSIIIGDSHEYAPIADQDDLGIFYNEMAINDIILREAKRILDLNDWSIARNWTGFYAQHPQKEIYQHTIENRIHIVTGIGGKGMTTGAGFSCAHVQKVLS
ncbi:MAG: TIGR03364 family FAD-dependent oxidoreductase [Taibaiella sp.]|jgi:FAD dependent oxidoreductase TIGR03364